MVGGGEILRDEQIFMAHKCADPAKYAPPAETLSENDRALLEKYKPTDVQLQVWDDLCHVAPTLSFTRPAKFMYRSVAQFGAWALARAQKRGIDILDDDSISVISRTQSDATTSEDAEHQKSEKRQIAETPPGQVGKAGDPLPNFRKHMIRQKVTRHGVTLPLASESELPALAMSLADVGVVKERTVKKWMATRDMYDQKYASTKAKVHKKIVKDMVHGFEDFGSGERPPPTALAGRRRIESDMAPRKKTKSLGLAIWSLWGSKHDEETVEREQEAEEAPAEEHVTGDEGRGSRPFPDIVAQQPGSSNGLGDDIESRSRSRRRTVVDEHQTEESGLDENTPVAQLLEKRREKQAASGGLLSPGYVPETGVAGKRPFIDGVALPFSLKKEAETASMVTLNSSLPPADGSRPMSPASVTDVSGQPAEEDSGRAEQMLASATTETTNHTIAPQVSGADNGTAPEK